MAVGKHPPERAEDRASTPAIWSASAPVQSPPFQDPAHDSAQQVQRRDHRDKPSHDGTITTRSSRPDPYRSTLIDTGAVSGIRVGSFVGGRGPRTPSCSRARGAISGQPHPLNRVALLSARAQAHRDIDTLLWISVCVGVFAFAVDVLVLLSARNVEMVRCMDGWTNLNSNRVPLTVMVIVSTLVAPWRAGMHVAFDNSAGRRRAAVAVIVAVVGAATLAQWSPCPRSSKAWLPDGFTIGGGC